MDRSPLSPPSSKRAKLQATQAGRTDRLLEELTSLREEVMVLKMYSVLCGTSVLVCAGDVINFVIKILDHSLKFEVACFPDFEVTLVGEKSKKPFQSSVGDGIRYTILLKFIAYLRGDLVQEKEARVEDHHLLSSCLLLLENAEKRVFGIIKAQGVVIKNSDGQVVHEGAFLSSLRGEVLKYCNLEWLWSDGREGQSKSSVSSIRKDQQDSVSSFHKDDRDGSAHPFSTLIWTEYNKPLVRTSDAFPKPSSYFQERNLAKTALLLQDLESKFDNNELGLAAEYITILPLGFFLIKTFIKQHNKVERSVAYKKIQAVIPGKVKNKDLPILVR